MTLPATEPARRKHRRPITVTTEVEVEVDEEMLADAGYVYTGGEPIDVETNGHVARRVERWHNETHAGPFPWCTDPLCHDVREIVR